MAINDKIGDEKLQHHISKEVPVISVISSGRVDKYEYLTGEEIPPSDQVKI